MITREEAQRIKDELLRALDEDAHNSQRLLGRLDAISRESGIGAHSALLLILTHLAFDEPEARRHWSRIVEHRAELGRSLQRPVGVRVALLDYFVHFNRQLVQPTLIDLEMLDRESADAGRDQLTGLANERTFRSHLQQELRRARRYGQQAAVALFDLDGFSEVNSGVGELLGDRLLREAAILLSNNVRDIDLAARTGEDEFALLLPETDRNGALLVAERYRSGLQRFFASREMVGRTVNLTVSGGVASYPGDAKTGERLLELAAQALYQSKAAGRNAVQSYRPERRRYLRFELEPGLFEIEVLAPAQHPAPSMRNLSRNGILFVSPERLEIGEPIEIRLAQEHGSTAASVRLRGTVVRLEELPLPVEAEAEVGEGLPVVDRYEIGVAFDLDWGASSEDLLGFLEQVQTRRLGHRG